MDSKILVCVSTMDAIECVITKDYSTYYDGVIMIKLQLLIILYVFHGGQLRLTNVGFYDNTVLVILFTTRLP